MDYGTDPTSSDTDGDGLTDGAEINLHGTDPLVSDTDKDGLPDGDEISIFGTNPLNKDTDGDGYTDADELNVFQTDPLDSASGGYIGGWPVQPNKDSLNGPTSPVQTSNNIGDLLLRKQLLDQFEQMVDLFDFAEHGKYLTVVFSAT